MSGQARRPSPAVVRLVIAAAGVAALVLGGGAGGLVLGAEGVIGGPDPRQLPDLPAEFPDPGVQYLPELTVTEITSSLAERGLECELVIRHDTADRQGCWEPGSRGIGWTWSVGGYHIVIKYDAESQVRALTTECYRQVDDPAGLCQAPFRLVADIVLARQPPDAREQALEWVEQYAHDEAIIDNETDIVTRAGEITLTVSGFRYDDGDAVYELVHRRA